MLELFLDLVGYMRDRGKYWLGPMIMVMLLVGGIIVLTETSSAGAFLYTLF